MTNLLLSILFYSPLTGGNNHLKTPEAFIKQSVSVITSCTKSSNYTTEPISYYCEKTGQTFIISESGNCTITAESCLLAQKMAMDCAVFFSKSSIRC